MLLCSLMIMMALTTTTRHHHRCCATTRLFFQETLQWKMIWKQPQFSSIVSVNLFSTTSSTSTSSLDNNDKKEGNNRIFTSSSAAETHQSTTNKPKTTHYYVPKVERNESRNVYDLVNYQFGDTRLSRNSRTCPTRELNFEHRQWHRHKSPYRKLRHMINLFNSAPFQRLLFPDLFFSQF